MKYLLTGVAAAIAVVAIYAVAMEQDVIEEPGAFEQLGEKLDEGVNDAAREVEDAAD